MCCAPAANGKHCRAVSALRVRSTTAFKHGGQAGLLRYDALQGLEWEWQAMDGAMTKAPLGGEKGGQEPDRSRQARDQTERADRWPWYSTRSRRGWRQSP